MRQLGEFVMSDRRVIRRIPCDIIEEIVKQAKDKLSLKALITSPLVFSTFLEMAGGMIPYMDEELCDLIPVNKVRFLTLF